MNDLRAVISHLDHFIVIQLAHQLCIGKFFGIGIHHTFHILPYHLAFGIQQVGEYGGGIITAFAAQGGAFVFAGRADKALGNDALALLQKKKNLRLLKLLHNPAKARGYDLRSVGVESYLLQERDLKVTAEGDLKIVTKRWPAPEELRAMLFGWRVVKHLKSNAIVYVGADRTLGVGAGQMSRVDSSRIAVWKAGEAGLPLKGSVVCSDAFFPFPDGLIAAADAGATAAIQPGGSMRDADVIGAADERGMAMAFTGVRHFRH